MKDSQRSDYESPPQPPSAINIQTEGNEGEPSLNKNKDSFYHKYNLDRWEYLYQKDITLKMKREEEIRKRQEEYSDSQMKECTFKPNLCNDNKFTKFMKPDENRDFFQRTTSWKKTVNKKINELQKKSSAEQVSECTFAPNVEPEKKNYLKGYQNLEKNINK